MARPTATVLEYNALTHAMISLQNCGSALVNLAYGTPARTQATLLFTCGLALLGSLIAQPETQAALSVCTN